MNPVHLEMVKIDRRWKQVVRENPASPLFICLGEKHEVHLFETYFKYQLREDARTDDMYLIHYQDFNDAQTYGASLQAEWTEAFNEWQKAAPDVADWQTATDTTSAGSDAHLPVQSLSMLCQLYPGVAEHAIYVQVAPTVVSDFNAFRLWISDWCQAVKKTGRTNIRLVLTDHHQHQTYKKLSNAARFRVETNLSSMMQNAAEFTNPKKGDPEADYQQQILVASNELAKGNHDLAVVALEKAIRIARRQKLNPAEVTARLMLAQCLAPNGKTSAAHAEYKEAISAAGEENLVAAQIHMNYASFLLSQSEQNKAKEYFAKTVDIAEEIGNDFIAMECTRLIGQLSEGILSGDAEAIRHYERCLEIARNMEAEKRRQSSMPYVAGILIKKYGQQSDAGRALNEEMQTFFGPEWIELTKKPKTMK
ncbi:tetratricopeptide repeat protein [Pedobacter sp. SYP-B3415]|uniref:tetratricopeptide repeat protein n=1 Tax=Pedobacter sp. SYP-B3415 TaxID=2496641 RepID=UPI00101CA324|nr:tetratricopeptide repeat protein [Pedobacter sp. SYP-B3415]